MLTSINDEYQADEDDLFGILVETELKGLPQTQKCRLKHETNNLIFNYKLQNGNDINPSEQTADKIQSPTFNAKINKSFRNAGHSCNDTLKLFGINMFKVNKKTLEQDMKYIRS